jgi:hypothetical protein
VQIWVPDDLMAVQAYILWEKAGRPEGADFSHAAREEIHRQLKAGQSLTQIEKALRGPPTERGAEPKAAPKPAPKGDAPKAAGKPAEAPAAGKPAEAKREAPPPPPAGDVEVGHALDIANADPLKLIKSATVPLLSGEKRKKQTTPLEFLVQVRAAAPNHCVPSVSRPCLPHECAHRAPSVSQTLPAMACLDGTPSWRAWSP